MDVDPKAVKLLVKQDELSIKVSKKLLDKSEPSALENYIIHSLNTIPQANKMLVWGIQKKQSLAIANALRVLLENWANTSYILSAGKKRDIYAEKIQNSAISYAEAFESLRNEPSKGVKLLQDIPKWTTSRLKDRVERLGDGPDFQYELLSRYTHSDVWSVINDDLISDIKAYNSIMLRWGVEFINHTLWTIYKAEFVPADYSSDIEDLNKEVQDLIKN